MLEGLDQLRAPVPRVVDARIDRMMNKLTNRARPAALRALV